MADLFWPVLVQQPMAADGLWWQDDVVAGGGEALLAAILPQQCHPGWARMTQRDGAAFGFLDGDGGRQRRDGADSGEAVGQVGGARRGQPHRC